MIGIGRVALQSRISGQLIVPEVVESGAMQFVAS
jgi:hypothetical protein